jgi:hypothetical protein
VVKMDIIIDHNKLKREVYGFYFQNEFHIYFDSYRLEERKTLRHKFVMIRKWNRIDDRQNDIKLEEIIFDENIKQKVREQLLKQINIELWKDR